LLEAYDTSLRDNEGEVLPAGVTRERDGPVFRLFGFSDGQGFVGYRDLGGIEGADLDALIARQVEFFARRGERFEWKLHSHDRPPDLAARLRAAGFVPEEEETVLIAPVERIPTEQRPPAGIALREVSERRDLERIEAHGRAVFGDRSHTVADDLEGERTADPEAIAFVVAEAGETVVCAGWVRFQTGTDFATLWGGSTLPAWRSRGIYRALVAYRAQLAAARGFRYLEVDASKESRPILGRLGFVAVTTTTPYLWSPG
jgi:GNAT superfamily N-acetyltransferase